MTREELLEVKVHELSEELKRCYTEIRKYQSQAYIDEAMKEIQEDLIKTCSTQTEH